MAVDRKTDRFGAFWFQSSLKPGGAVGSGIADGLRTWGWQLAAVRLPPGPGRELWRGTLTKAQYT